MVLLTHSSLLLCTKSKVYQTIAELHFTQSLLLGIAFSVYSCFRRAFSIAEVISKAETIEISNIWVEKEVELAMALFLVLLVLVALSLEMDTDAKPLYTCGSTPQVFDDQSVIQTVILIANQCFLQSAEMIPLFQLIVEPVNLLGMPIM